VDDPLVSQAYAEKGLSPPQPQNEFSRDAEEPFISWVAGAWGYDYCVWVKTLSLLECEPVVAVDYGLDPQLAEILHEVIDERV
jgi:hypothetical protein